MQSVVFASCSCNHLCRRISTLTGDHDGATPGLPYPLNRRSTRRDANQVFLFKSIRPVEGQEYHHIEDPFISFSCTRYCPQITPRDPETKIFEPVKGTLSVVPLPIQFHTRNVYDPFQELNSPEVTGQECGGTRMETRSSSHLSQ